MVSYAHGPRISAHGSSLTFLQSRVAVGVKIGKRCDDTMSFVTSYHVSTSPDDVTWSYMGTDVQAVYEGIIATWWIDMEVSATGE